MSTRLISKEEFASLILNEEVSFEERIQLITHEMKIELPPDIEDGQLLLDFVYDYYIKAFEAHNIAIKRAYQKPAANAPREGTIKEWVINYIFEHKTVKISELRSVVDEQFQYKDKGKSSRTRVRKVVLQLLEDKKITKIDSDTIQWV